MKIENFRDSAEVAKTSGLRVAPGARAPLEIGHFGRASKNLIFHSEGPKNIPRPLSPSIFCADRKYGLGFSIRPREDR